MKRKTFCVTFFLRRARTFKKGLAPILARITTNGISNLKDLKAPFQTHFLKHYHEQRYDTDFCYIAIS